MKRLALLSALLPLTSSAVPESRLAEVRLAYSRLGTLARSRDFSGSGQLRLHSLEYAGRPGGPVVVVVPGRSEAAGRYTELALDLIQDGAGSVFVLDHRGQGKSSRLLADPEKGHVDDFTRYVSDLDLWMRTVVLPAAGPRRIVLHAHSMGGAVVALYLAALPAQERERFSWLVLTAPMFGIAHGRGLLEKLAEISCRPGNSSCESYIPGTGAYTPGSFAENLWTENEPRFQLNESYFALYPAERIGGPTWGWVNQALIAARRIREAPRIGDLPVTIFQAEAERIVDNDSQREFCDAQKQCRLIPLRGARHSILENSDPLRSQVLSELRLRLQARSSALLPQPHAESFR